jgi:hypothetical protein
MRVIVEIDTEEEIERLEKFLKFLDPAIIRKNYQVKADKVESFLNFVDKQAVLVDQIIIPSREERNAR